jgi:hypothetical protein
MKPLGFTVSVLKDTNRVVASSEIDLMKVKAGDYFTVNGEPVFYTIARCDKFFYIKDFEVIDSRSIKLNTEVGINLIPGDNLKITYREYELKVFIDIKFGGVNYKVDDVITVLGGTPSVNRQNGLTETTSFTVLEVDDKGSILSLGPRSKGVYIDPPSQISEVIGGKGVGAVLEVGYSVLDQRATVENVVAKVPDISQGIVVLDFPLPPSLKDGKLSVEKWQFTLTSPYLGESKINATYDIASNFTTNLRLPLMLQNSFQRELIYNEAMNILEQRVVALEARIRALESN